MTYRSPELTKIYYKLRYSNAKFKKNLENLPGPGDLPEKSRKIIYRNRVIDWPIDHDVKYIIFISFGEEGVEIF